MSKRILIVEDELLIAGNIERMLTRNGYEVPAIAIDYQDAVDFLKKQEFDLALLDVTLSGSLNGLDVAKYIQRNQKIPFIYCTSYTDSLTINALKSTKPLGYISKPIQEATLVTNLDLYFNREDHRSTEVTIQVGSATYHYEMNDLLYAQADHVYTELVHKKGTDVLRISLQALQDQFPEDEMIRVNRSVLVSRRAVTMLDRTSVYVGDHDFKVSKSNWEEVEKLLK